MASLDIVAIGGSAGSNTVITELIAALPSDLPASVFLTTHLPSTHESYLPELIGRASRLPVAVAVDGQPVEQGRVYFAPRDRHLLIWQGAVRLGEGPRENMTRPSIDPMFRSAALTYGPRTIGVVLSGLLNDGASGLSAIKQVGGVAVVQHPLDAQASDMPRAALDAVDVDHVVRTSDLPATLLGLVGSPAGVQRPTPESLAFEVEIAAGRRLGSERLRSFADPAPLTCPECQGVLSEVRGAQPLRYRCQIGHAFTAEQLAAKHETLDEAVRIAMRVMEERVELVERMARDARQTGRYAVAELYEARGVEYRRYAEVLREAAIASLRTGEPLTHPPSSV